MLFTDGGYLLLLRCYVGRGRHNRLLPYVVGLSLLCGLSINVTRKQAHSQLTDDSVTANHASQPQSAATVRIPYEHIDVQHINEVAPRAERIDGGPRRTRSMNGRFDVQLAWLERRS